MFGVIGAIWIIVGIFWMFLTNVDTISNAEGLITLVGGVILMAIYHLERK